MSLVEDVRRDLYETIEANDYTGYTWSRCLVCHLDDGHHEDDCVVPRIVVALEAAERVSEAFEDADRRGDGRLSGGAALWTHIQALVSALKGDKA